MRAKEREGKLRTIVALESLDREGHGQPELREELQDRALIELAVEPEHPEARTVVEGGVLDGLLPIDLDDLGIDLDRVAGVRLLEQPELTGSGGPLSGSR
jgi:hypothetical protein